MEKTKGFTLIELMIVVAIIGILSAIAIPKFADLIRKSNEGATKGNLGAVRSAITIYYGTNAGLFPSVTASGDEIHRETRTWRRRMPLGSTNIFSPNPASLSRRIPTAWVKDLPIWMKRIVCGVSGS